MLKRKIIFCDNSLTDQINFREDVINDYAADGFKVILVSPLNCDYHPAYPNIRHVSLKLTRSSMNPLNDLKYMWRLVKIYHKERPDYIFHYTIKPNIYGTLAAKLCGIPSTAMIAGLGYVFDHKGFGCAIARCLYRFSLQFAQKVLVLNSYNRDLVIEKRIAKPEQVILLPGGEGINLEKFK